MTRSPKNRVEQAYYSCEDLDGLVDDYIDQELSPSQVKRFEMHLENCEVCHEMVRDCQFLVANAERLDEIPIPEEVSRRLREALEEKVGMRRPPEKLIRIRTDES